MGDCGDDGDGDDDWVLVPELANWDKEGKDRDKDRGQELQLR